MFIELIDLLRCPVEHEESWLVAAFTKMDRRFVIEGKLGCPVCFSSYPIVDGVAEFAPPESLRSSGSAELSEEGVMRIAALLGLTRPGMSIVLDTDYAALAPSITEMTGARAITLNATESIPEAHNVGAATSGTRFPFASRSIDGVATASEQIREAGRVLKPGGRLVAPASVRVGSGWFRELARDERNVVLESVGELVRLSR